MTTQIQAILSSTVLNVEGVYEAKFVSMPEVGGIPHYVGHPATKELLDTLGAVHTTGLFGGLEVGQSFLAVPVQNPSRDEGWTVHKAIDGLQDLRVTLITRIA